MSYINSYSNPLNLLALSTAASMNKVPSYLRNVIYKNNRNYGIKYRYRSGNTVTTRTRRRNNRRKIGKGIEVNKAEGGEKLITLPYRTQGIGINTYARLAIVKVGESWNYAIQPENDNYANHEEYNIITMLNASTEFKERLRTTSQYRIIGINICIMNERIPEAKDKLSRLLVYANTTKVAVLDPKIQNNVMRLNMNTVGTKNFNFKLNNSNIGKDFTGWYDGDDLYTGNVYLHVQSEDINVINDDTQSTIVLGTIRITFNVLTRIQDYVRNNDPQKKKTTDEKIEELTEKIKEIDLKVKH
jgi:hypothetical protein